MLWVIFVRACHLALCEHTDRKIQIPKVSVNQMILETNLSMFALLPCKDQSKFLCSAEGWISWSCQCSHRFAFRAQDWTRTGAYLPAWCLKINARMRNPATKNLAPDSALTFIITMRKLLSKLGRHINSTKLPEICSLLVMYIHCTILLNSNILVQQYTPE